MRYSYPLYWTWPLSHGPYWLYSWAPKVYGPKIRCFNPASLIKPDVHKYLHLHSVFFVSRIRMFAIWKTVLIQYRQVTWITDNLILSLYFYAFFLLSSHFLIFLCSSPWAAIPVWYGVLLTLNDSMYGIPYIEFHICMIFGEKFRNWKL